MSNDDLKKALTIYKQDVLMDIEVSPNSKKFEIAGFNVWRNRVEIRIKQIPQKKKSLVSKYFKIFNFLKSPHFTNTMLHAVES